MGLIAQYRLHGDAIESIGGFDGTITGSPTTAVGKLGQCLEFDGSTGQYISTSLNLHGLSEFSISCWARGDSWKHTTHTIVASNYDSLILTILSPNHSALNVSPLIKPVV